MASIDPVFAQWLQDDRLRAVMSNQALTERWGNRALTAERMTCIALRADAIAEAVRRLNFFGVPLGVDEHVLKGQYASLLGRVITLTIKKLGYENGADVLLIGVEDDLSTGICKATVLRRLG
jgi:hypothetical protein